MNKQPTISELADLFVNEFSKHKLSTLEEQPLYQTNNTNRDWFVRDLFGSNLPNKTKELYLKTNESNNFIEQSKIIGINKNLIGKKSISEDLHDKEEKKALKKSQVPELLGKRTVQTYRRLERQEKRRDKHKAKTWWEIPERKISRDVKRDMKVIMNRAYLDPKRFYKSSDWKGNNFPKRFQRGTVVEHASEFYSSRLTRKRRGQNIAEQFYNDKQLRNYTNQKYKEVKNERDNRRIVVGKKHNKMKKRRRKNSKRF
ncbi:hypothetical protein M0813_10236 [Anaeramoeba flamelloides]|uniref:Fcf2 pre-rRNA processing C-terminal domain-containing protein n=1 Tax=Anaeramoeba flamelloides TaxID=1746091 RepID=A0AAV7ZIL0_9EUKA|nr:hypothetical protein M0812_16324 [Anaeramoeba flamelloides]KAJ6227083.1 hypothetical protein M0813_10236 [Anaeramoeba flamelloides]